MTAILYGIPISTWISYAANKMEATGVEDPRSWSRYWAETYQDLGGRSSSGEKGCPRSAAYALWYLGWVKGTQRPRLNWSIGEIREKLGKNAAYAAIAAGLLVRGVPPQPRDVLWESVRQDFQRQTGLTAAKSEQGAVKVAMGLFLEGELVVP